MKRRLNQNTTSRSTTFPSREKLTFNECIAPKTLENLGKVIQSDISIAVQSALEKGAWKDLLDLEIDPRQYQTAEAFRGDYLLCEMMSKYPEWDLGVDRELVALSKFIDSEVACAKTNRELSSRLRGHLENGVSVGAVFLTAAHKISHVLGLFDWNTCAEAFEWGPGASVGIPRRYSDAYYKFGKKPTVSRNAVPLADAYKRFHETWEFTPEIVPGSCGTTVPKNAKTDRFIAIEPSLNLYFQKGIGRMIRKGLNKGPGLLLRDAQERNAELARIGSIDGSLSTIDLSSASDSIAMQLIYELLPEDWLRAIEYTRSQVCVLPKLGMTIHLEKVSSMGNGFTFELETLLFWALASSVTILSGENGHQCSVYGDDIVCPTRAAAAVIELLALCGFVTNQKKTFIEGPFRESCGKHWFRGTDVTPFYVRETVLTKDRVCWLANSIREWASSLGYGDPRYYDTWLSVVNLLPVKGVFPVPRHFGHTAGLIVELHELPALKLEMPTYSREKQAYVFRYSSQITLKKSPDDDQRKLKSLYVLDRKWGLRDPSEETDQVRLGNLPRIVTSQSHRQILGSIRGSWEIGSVPRSFKPRVLKGVSSGWAGFGSWAV